jgi:ribose transport system substrate-binding protein
MVAAMATLPACGVVTVHQERIAPAAGKTIHLAVVPKSVGLQFWEQVHQGAECAAKQLPDVQITWNGVTDESDVVGQINMLQNYAARGLNGLVYAATDAQALAEVSQSAVNGGLKVVNFDSGTTPQPPEVPVVATDNVKSAQQVADLLAQAIGPQGGEIAFIRFHQGSQTDTQREQGFLDGLKKHPELKLVATQSSQSDATIGLAVGENILTAHPNLKGIFAANESGVVGAVEALRRAGKAHTVAVVGWDASSDEIDSLRLGIVSALVAQNPFRMGYQGVADAVAMIRDQAQPRSIDTGAVYATKDNMNSPEVHSILFPQCGDPVSEGKAAP